MEGNYVVKELIETKRKKNGEVHIVYRTLLVEENTNTKMILVSEDKPVCQLKDEFVFKKVAFQKKIKGDN